MRILIVEDDPTSALVLRRTLEKFGHEVEHCGDGRAAWERFQTDPFRVVISDWMMPEMDGVELCRHIRSVPQNEYTFFLLLTAKTGKTERIQALEAGADEFLTKPLDLGELTARLNTCHRILTMQDQLNERSHELKSQNRLLAKHRDELEEQRMELADNAAMLGEVNMLLQVASHRFQELFHSLPVACYTFDSDHSIREWNRASEALFNVPSDFAFGRRVEEILGANTNDNTFADRFNEVLSGAVMDGYETTLVREDGTVRHLLCYTFPFRNMGREIIGAIASIVDITERKRAESALQAMQEELEARVADRTTELAASNMALQEQIVERTRSEERVQQQVQQLNSLHSIDMAISASLDLRHILNVFLDQALTLLNVDAVAVYLYSPSARTLECAAERGFAKTSMLRKTIPPRVDLCGEIAFGHRPIHLEDVRVPGSRPLSPSRQSEGFVGYYGLPLIAKGQMQGVLELYCREPISDEPEWHTFVEMLAGQAAIAIDNTTLFNKLQRSNADLELAYDTTLEGWVKAIDLRDKETEGHTRRVTEMTLRLAGAMGVPESDIVHIRRGALLHDIGKMGIPDSILLKQGPLSSEERKAMQQHTRYAYDMLSPIAFLRPALDIPYCHHEKWDGTGYPRGLAGHEIPLAARLFAIVDVWDALTNSRPYKPAWSREQVHDHLVAQRGSHFDPDVVDHFMQILAADAAAQQAESLGQEAA